MDALLGTLGPLVAPLVLEVFNQVVLPELQKLEAQIGSPDLKVVVDAAIAAITSIGQKEIPKI